MEYGGKERERQSFCLFLVFSCISLLLSRALKYANTPYFCRQKHAVKRKTDKGVIDTNKTELQTK